VQVNIKNLIDDVQCYQTVRGLRWPDGVHVSLVSLSMLSSVALMTLNLPVNVMSVTTVANALVI
jgi:hypothetical protein